MKKVISIISIVLVALLVGTTITLACVKTKTFDGINALGEYDKISVVEVYKDGSTTAYQSFNSKVDKTTIDKIVKLHKDSLKDNVLSAMFQGALGFEAKFETLSSSISFSDIVKDSTCILFKFDEKQNLKWDDEEIKNSSNKNVEYNQIVMRLNNSKNYADVAIYVLNSSTSSSYKITVSAHQYELYKYISNMEYSGN